MPESPHPDNPKPDTRNSNPSSLCMQEPREKPQAFKSNFETYIKSKCHKISMSLDETRVSGKALYSFRGGEGQAMLSCFQSAAPVRVPSVLGPALCLHQLMLQLLHLTQAGS